MHSSGSPAYQAVMAERRRELVAQVGQIFADERSYVLEIGCGHGHFLNAYARRHPERLCVGIDIVGERIERAARKRDRARLGNLHFLHAEARLYLDCVPAGVRAASIFLLFPDPWPKLRHHKNRLMQASLLAALAAHAERGCRLCFRTDHEAYFQAATAQLGASPEWERVEEAWPFEFNTVFQQRASSHQSLVARLRA